MRRLREPQHNEEEPVRAESSLQFDFRITTRGGGRGLFAGNRLTYLFFCVDTSEKSEKVKDMKNLFVQNTLTSGKYVRFPA